MLRKSVYVSSKPVGHLSHSNFFYICIFYIALRIFGPLSLMLSFFFLFHCRVPSPPRVYLVLLSEESLQVQLALADGVGVGGAAPRPAPGRVLGEHLPQLESIRSVALASRLPATFPTACEFSRLTSRCSCNLCVHCSLFFCFHSSMPSCTITLSRSLRLASPELRSMAALHTTTRGRKTSWECCCQICVTYLAHSSSGDAIASAAGASVPDHGARAAMRLHRAGHGVRLDCPTAAALRWSIRYRRAAHRSLLARSPEKLPEHDDTHRI